MRGIRDHSKPHRKRGGGGGGNNWLWRNMYSVAEEEEEDLADFGLQHLATDDNVNNHQQHHHHQIHDEGGYHAPLLENSHSVDDLIRNPMGESQQHPHNTINPRNNTNNNSSEEENFGTFVLLKRLKLLPKNDGYAYVSDLDAFFSSLYNYYYLRGLGSIIGKGIVEIVSLFFTLWLSLILFAYIDWGGLSQCNDENTCHDSFLEAYIIQSPFSSGRRSFLRNSWIVIYCLLFSTYGFFCLIQYGHSIIASLECKVFLEEVLGVSDRDLEVGRVEWGDIVERMSEAQRVGKCRVAILPGRMGGVDAASSAAASQSRSNISMNHQQQQHDEEIMGGHHGPTGHLVVAQRIMRRENYFIAFVNKGLLDLTIPTLPPWLWPLTTLTNKPKEDKTIFHSKSIEWSIYFCVLNYMFNHSRKIRPAFYGDPSSLRRRFFLCGVAHFVFMPFLLFFVTLHFFMSNVYDWQSTKEYLGPREWSSMARWTFREFNELPHSFERRMEPSYKSAAAYLEMFGRPSPFKVALGRLLVFVSGSLGTLLLAFAAMNDAILLHVKIGQWNLLWYAGVLGACFSVGKGMLPKPTSPYFGHARRNLISDMNLELEKLATHTHYLPDAWRGKGWDDRTKKAFAPMFQFKANHFAHEVLSIMAAPLILCVSLPQCADKLCKFVRDSKVEVPSIGDMVGYSTFDFDSFEDEQWRGKGILEQSSRISIRDIGEGIKINDRPKSRHGKMEKSFFSEWMFNIHVSQCILTWYGSYEFISSDFKGVYPNWTMPPSGKNLVDQVESYRHQQDIALARERRLHIDAAAAQLETLRRLEIDREKRSAAGLSGFVDDRHIDRVSSGPDSGGGGAHGILHNTNESLSDFGLDGLDPSESFGSLSHDGLHHPHIHFEESAHSFAPPTHAFAHHSLVHGEDIVNARIASPRAVSPSRYMLSNNIPGNVTNYTDATLSMELRGVLNGSTLVDPSASQQSFTGSLVPMDDASTSILDIRADQQ
ncbi:hypothetical protein ACHAXR_005866, partial [Thalassiosira sp. AJA248-18]